MKRKLLYSLLVLTVFLGFAQESKFEISPFADITTSIKDGQIEVGPELNWERVNEGTALVLRPTIRIPMTNRSENVLQIDRFSSTWRGVLALRYIKDNTGELGNISRHAVTGQFEYGWADYTYYPTGKKSSEQVTGKASYGFEAKYVGFFSKGSSGARQFSPQFRLRYSHDWEAAAKIGVVNPPNDNDIVTTTDLIIDAPKVKATFSPAFTLQFYPGKGSFSYAPALYYDFMGKEGTNDPFGGSNRLRLEGWIFFYPLVEGNVKIGVSPFLSLRTAGMDDFKKNEYGGLVTIKYGTTFLHFL